MKENNIKKDIEEQFLTKGIPTWNNKQIEIFFGNKSYKEYIIGPKFLVCFKSYHCFLHTSSLVKFLNKLEEIMNFFQNPDFKLYLYITQYKNESNDFNIIKKKLTPIIEDIKDNNKIKIINSKDDIKIIYPKYIASQECIKSFVSCHQDLYPIFKNKNIYTSQKNWNRSIVIMYPHEEKLLHKFNITILPNEELIKMFNEDICCILQQSTTYKFYKENQFSYQIKNMKLGDSARVAVQYIKGVSDFCKGCNRLTFSKHIYGDNKDSCITCQRINSQRNI